MKLVCCAALALLGLVAAPAQADRDPREVADGLVRFRSFGSADGLRNLVILSFAQDAAGLLWIGTDDGVFRYDGERFSQLGTANGLRAAGTTVLGVAPDGNVCAGGAAGMACWDGSRFTRAAGLPDVAVYAIASAQGRMWVGTEHGLYVRAPGGFVRAPGWTGTSAVRAVWVDGEGVVAADDGQLIVSAGDGVWHARTDAGLTGDRIGGIVRDPRGALWIRTADHVWRLARDAVRAEDLTAGLPPSDDVGASGKIVNGGHGEVWVACNSGVAYRDGDHWHVLGRATGAPFSGARTVFSDREGALWVGAVGVFQQRGRGLIERFDRSNGLPGTTVWSIARDAAGTLWAGTNLCLSRMENGRWQCVRGSEDRTVRSFAFPPQGGVFLGGFPADLRYVSPSGEAISLGREVMDAPEQAILAIRIGPEGDLWVATRFGLFRLPGALPGPLERVAIAGIPADDRFSSLVVADGRVWATTKHGIVAHSAAGWRTYGTSEGFRAASMRYLVHTGGHGYCVTYVEPLGVTCFEAAGDAITAVRHIDHGDGRAPAIVYLLGTDLDHRLWIGTGDGIAVVSPGGIDGTAPPFGGAAGRGAPTVEHFTEDDGLAGNDAAATAFFRDGDGSLWFGSTGGLSHVHAERYREPPALGVRIRGGQLGAQLLGDHPAAGLETTHALNALRVELGFDRLVDASVVEYGVRLLPQETEWSVTSLREAHYPSLVAGTYRLEVRGRVTPGAWGAVTGLSFVVRAAWWQTGWFRGLVAGGILLAIAVATSWRQRSALRRRTRQLNERSAASVRALLELIPDLISVHRAGKVIYCNLAARRLYGFEAEQAVVGLGDRVHADDRAWAAAMTQDLGAQGGQPKMTELRVRDADGHWRICEVSGVWMELAGAHVLVFSGRDVTERHELRAQLLVSDRMASLGTLAAGVAHEINNPLAYVLGNLQVMTEVLERPGNTCGELAGAVGNASDGAERVRKIVQGLRSFSRAEEEQRVKLDVAEVLRASIRLTANEVRHRAQLVCELGTTPPVMADDGRLTQVFINLIVNAAHAIPDGNADGNRITVRTRTDELGRAVIEIEDTGCGMALDVQARVFDPFYTTKAIGGGTGLGLSICHGIVTALGGQIEVVSVVGQGTRVRVALPPVIVASAAVAPAVSGPLPVVPARLRVLLVDDEPQVVDVLARLLGRDHEVVTAACGRTALARVGEGGWFDAIVSDIMMPNMTGLELLDALVTVAPEQAKQMIFLSGGVFTPETRARLDRLGTVQLEKPVSTKELRKVVMRVASARAR